jgi:hypothetical protein
MGRAGGQNGHRSTELMKLEIRGHSQHDASVGDVLSLSIRPGESKARMVKFYCRKLASIHGLGNFRLDGRIQQTTNRYGS